MNKKALLILFFLATPIFIRLTTFGSSNFKTVIVFLLLSFFIINVLKKKDFRYPSNPLSVYNFLFTIIIIIEFSLTGISGLSFNLFVKNISPFIASILLIYYFSSFNELYKIKLIEKIFKGIGIIFVLQFLLSLYEMKNASPLIDYGFVQQISIYQNTELFTKRSILDFFGLHFNFKFPLTMLLGQWNYSAPHLAIYNLIFLVSFYFKKSKYFLSLIGLVFLATLLNTTRAAIITVILTDIIFGLFYFRGNKFVRNLLRFGLIIIVIAFFYNILPLLEYYFSKTDTLTGRLDYYSTYLYYISNNITSDILGHGFIKVMELGYKLRAMAGYGGGSFESQFFSIFFTYGILGLGVFILFLINSFNYHYNIPKVNRIFLKLLVISIILTSLTLGGIFFIYTYPFMTLLYLYLIEKNKLSQLEKDMEKITIRKSLSQVTGF